jgi:hypothetical protein
MRGFIPAPHTATVGRYMAHGTWHMAHGTWHIPPRQCYELNVTLFWDVLSAVRENDTYMRNLLRPSSRQVSEASVL